MEHYKLRENDITELSEFWVSRSDNPFLCLPSGVIKHGKLETLSFSSMIFPAINLHLKRLIGIKVGDDCLKIWLHR